MIEVGQAEVGLQVLQQVDHLRLHRDVQRGHRLVGDDQVRVHGQRPGDADPLPLPAGELVRVLAQRACSAARPRTAARAAGRSSRHPWSSRPCACIPSTRIDCTDCRGSSEDSGSWNTICIRRRACRSGSAFSVGDVLPVEDHRAGRRLHQPQDAAAESGLAATGFADQPVGLAAPDGQRDAVDRVDVADRLVDQHAPLDREMHLEVVDLQQHVRARGRRATARRPARPAAARTRGRRRSTRSVTGSGRGLAVSASGLTTIGSSHAGPVVMTAPRSARRCPRRRPSRDRHAPDCGSAAGDPRCLGHRLQHRA